mgnify:CR=1 FL=1
MAKSIFSKLAKKSPSISKSSKDLLHSRFVLYFVFVIAVANLFHFIFSNDFMSCTVFIVAGLLTSFFSKNMVVIMVIAIVVTHVIRIGNSSIDGFENKEKGLDEQFTEALKAIEEIENMEEEGEEEEEEDGEDGDNNEEDEDDEDDDEDDDDEEEEEEEEFSNKEPFKSKKSKKSKKGKKGKK